MRPVALILVIALLALPAVVRADLAPTVYEGLTPRPVGQSQVRMDSEYVEITLGPRMPDHYIYPAHVSARFFMVNDGTDTLAVGVGFPVFAEFDIPALHSDDIYQFRVSINGGDHFAPTAPGPREGAGPSLWYGWSMRFAPGLTVVDVDYDIRSSYTKGSGLQLLGYTLETGRYWRDTIGHAVVRIVFPVTIEADMIMPRTSSGYSIAGNAMVWRFDDLEPTRLDDIWIEFIPPELHREIHTIDRELADRPIEEQVVYNDFTAQRLARLARIYLHLGGSGARNPSYPDFNRMAEPLLWGIVYKEPDNAGVWNALLSTYRRTHPDAFGMGTHTRGRLTDDQRELIARAVAACPTDERIALWAYMADDSSWVLPDTLGYVDRVRTDRVSLSLPMAGTLDMPRVLPDISPGDYAFVLTLYDAIAPSVRGALLVRNSAPVTPDDHRCFVRVFRSWYLGRAQREIYRLDRQLGKWANADGLIGGDQ